MFYVYIKLDVWLYVAVLVPTYKVNGYLRGSTYLIMSMDHTRQY